jgi:hypothetical protein
VPTDPQSGRPARDAGRTRAPRSAPRRARASWATSTAC